MGMFAVEDLPAGSFLGFYNGVLKDGQPKRRNSYTLQLSNVYIQPKTRSRGVVSAMDHPLAMCNEPPPGQKSNVFVKDFAQARDVIPDLPPYTQISAAGFYTCRHVRAGEELYFHYGREYNREKYTRPNDEKDLSKLVGTACKPLKNSDLETPRQMAQRYNLPFDSVGPDNYVFYDSDE